MLACLAITWRSSFANDRNDLCVQTRGTFGHRSDFMNLLGSTNKTKWDGDATNLRKHVMFTPIKNTADKEENHVHVLTHYCIVWYWKGAVNSQLLKHFLNKKGIQMYMTASITCWKKSSHVHFLKCEHLPATEINVQIQKPHNSRLNHYIVSEIYQPKCWKICIIHQPNAGKLCKFSTENASRCIENCCAFEVLADEL